MNPIKKTIDRHKKANQLIQAAVGDMTRTYEQSRLRLNSELQRIVLSSKQAPYSGKNLVALIEAMQKQYADLAEAFREKMGSAIPFVTQGYYFDALHDLGIRDTSNFDASRVRLFQEDAYTHIAGATNFMSATEVGNLRSVSAELLREVSMGGMTQQQASNELLNRLLTRDSQFRFTDAKGRVWNNKSYVNMLTRTTMMNAGREAYFNTCVENDDDVVQVTVSGAPCPDCAVWENRLLSITGATKGLSTVDDAIAAGLCHPNCTHSFVAVGDYIRKSEFDALGRPLEGYNSEEKAVTNEPEDWKAYRSKTA